MKKTITVFFIAIALFLQSIVVFADDFVIEYDNITEIYSGSFFNLSVNGKTPQMPLPPLIFNERSLVPVREVFETLGAIVEYDEINQSVTIDYNDNSVTIFINKSIGYVNGKKSEIPDGITPKLIAEQGKSAKTMVPVRFISENLGMYVGFEDNTIIINSNDYTPPTVDNTPNLTPDTNAQIALSDFGYNGISDGTLEFVFITGGRASYNNPFILSNPNRLVVDLPNCKMSLSNTSYDISTCGISKVRFGYENERTRIVIDCDKIKNYNVSYNSDNNLVVTVSTGVTTSNTPSIDNSEDGQINQTPNTGDIEEIPSIPYDNSSKVIVIDAGHGGSDGGAPGKLNGENYNEKDITLSVVKKIRTVLSQWGYTVILTRDSDTYPTLTARSNLANQSNAAVFVSVHVNSSTVSEPYGIESYYSLLNNGSEYGTTSEKLATSIQKFLIEATGTKNRGVKTANHVVTRTSLMPASLIEIGFMSNENELSKMLSGDYQDKIAGAIASGIADTVGNVTIPNNREELANSRIASLQEWENTK